MKTTLKCKCPYCQFEQHTTLTFDTPHKIKKVINCCLDEGGCDKDYVVMFDAPIINRTTYKLEKQNA